MKESVSCFHLLIIPHLQPWGDEETKKIIGRKKSSKLIGYFIRISYWLMRHIISGKQTEYWKNDSKTSAV